MAELDTRSFVRDLARRVAEIAASPNMVKIKQRWRDVNALRKSDRAPVWCGPVGCWAELLPEEALRSSDPWLRGIERELRRVLIKHEIGDDSPVEPYYAVSARLVCDPPNIWGPDIRKHNPDVPGGAWAYDPPLKTERDFDKLRMPRWSVDEEATQDAVERAEDLFRGVMPVRVVGRLPLSPTMGTDAADLRGLEQMMYDMAAAPELMHRLMAHIRDANLRAMRDLESEGVLTPNNIGPMFCSDPIGELADGSPRGHGGVTVRNLWGGANSQEFEGVSPDMWEQFCLAYQKPVLEKFGLTQYGCCENVTARIDGILTIPSLRIFVSSAWTDLNKVIERVGGLHTIMWRQKASEVVFAEDTSRIEQHLSDGMRRLHGCSYQVILRELQTLAGHPDRLHVWTRMAIAAAERHS